MNKFLVFAGDDYYPEGGWNDCQGVFDTEREAMQFVTNLDKVDWWHIIDLYNKKRVNYGHRRE